MAHSTVRGELDFISQELSSLTDIVSELEANIVESTRRLNAYDEIDKVVAQQIEDFGIASNIITAQYADLTSNLNTIRTAIESNVAEQVAANVLATDTWLRSADANQRFLFVSNGETQVQASASFVDTSGDPILHINSETREVSILGNLIASDIVLELAPNIFDDYGFGNTLTNTIDCGTLNANLITAKQIVGQVDVNLDDVVVDSSVIFENLEEVLNLSSLKIPNGELYVGNIMFKQTQNGIQIRDNGVSLLEIDNGTLIGDGKGLQNVVRTNESINLGSQSIHMGNVSLSAIENVLTFRNAIINTDRINVRKMNVETITVTPDLSISCGSSKSPLFNIAIGSNTLTNVSQSTHCIALGYKSMEKTATASDCVAIGSEALTACDAPGCVAIGKLSSGSLTSGKFNTSVGTGSLFYDKTGAENTSVGYRAGYGVTGSRSTAIGSYSLLNGGPDCIAIGHRSLETTYNGSLHSFNNVIGIGNNVHATGNNQVILGQSASDVYSFKPIQTIADSRDLTSIVDEPSGLATILKLRPRSFKYKPRDSNTIGTRTHHGLVVQDIQQAGVSEFYQNHAVNGGEDVLTIAYGELVGPLIKAIQELEARISALEA